MSSPNTTLYVNNLNDKVSKEEVRAQLLALFATYGRIIDIVASKAPAKRGQAFLVFSDLASATAALRACDGMLFYDKPLHISYAKTKSYATLRREDPSFVPPTSANASTIAVANSKSSADKRQREQDVPDADRATKREKGADDDDGEEMEIDEDDESAATKPAAVPPVLQRPSARLLCTNLPQEVTDDVLSVLFQQYKGFQTTHVAQSSTPNAAGAKAKMAQVFFDSLDLATVAKEALDGFTLKKGWQMTVAYI